MPEGSVYRFHRRRAAMPIVAIIISSGGSIGISISGISISVGVVVVVIIT